MDYKPGDLFNKFQQKKSKMAMHKKSKMHKPEKGESKAYEAKEEKMMKKGKKSMKKKNWIANAIKKPGALHKELGVKVGKKIPAKTLAKAAKKGGKEGKRARLAETLASFHHKKTLRSANEVVRSEQNASHQFKGKKKMSLTDGRENRMAYKHEKKNRHK